MSCQTRKTVRFQQYSLNLLIFFNFINSTWFFVFFQDAFFNFFQLKKLVFPCFSVKKYAMINVVLINNYYFITNIFVFLLVVIN